MIERAATLGGRLLAGAAVAVAAAVAETGTIVLRMTDGTELEYHGMPRATFDELVSSPSPGGYYNANIRGR